MPRLPPFSDPGVPRPLGHRLRTAVAPALLKWLCCGLMARFTCPESPVGSEDLGCWAPGVCSVWSERARPVPVPGSAAGLGPGVMFAEPPPGGSENTCLPLKTTPPQAYLNLPLFLPAGFILTLVFPMSTWGAVGRLRGCPPPSLLRLVGEPRGRMPAERSVHVAGSS